MEPGIVERQLLDTIAAVVQRGRECVDEAGGLHPATSARVVRVTWEAVGRGGGVRTAVGKGGACDVVARAGWSVVGSECDT